MAFKTFAALVAIALVALAPVQETNALSLPGMHSGSLVSRIQHSSLVRRQAKSNKRCPKYRGRGPQSSAASNTSTVSQSTTTSTSVPATSHTPTNNLQPSSSPATSTTEHQTTKPASTHTTTTSSSSADNNDDNKPTTDDKPPKTTSSSSSTPKPTSTQTTKTTVKEDPPKSTSSSSSAPKPTKATAPNYKAGMIFTQKFDGFLRKANDAVGGKLSATYNWGADRPAESIEEGVEFIPTFWGPKTIDDWGKVKRGYCKRVLGMNEVNQDGQATMSPDEGISLWKKYMAPLISEGIQLYSPSTSNAPSGMDWYDEFFRKCPECKEQTSAINIHYYSNNADGMIEYIKEIRDRYNLPVFVSEFGCANWSGRGAVDDGCDEAGVIDFITKTTNFMNSQSYVVGYMYFGFFPENDASGGVPSKNALYTSSGGLTAAGRAYLY